MLPTNYPSSDMNRFYGIRISQIKHDRYPEIPTFQSEWVFCRTIPMTMQGQAMLHLTINVENPTLQGFQGSFQVQHPMTELFIGIIQMLTLNIEHIAILEKHRITTRCILVQHRLSLGNHRDLVH